ncbi:lamin tail domain-containing protein [Candidatus Peregrinibacteria bacterium]|mgnify:FL=1|jgi:hypothetical protein|nr:lamin tail domain-containing protein [Candidatus Peregrinibacteria bacterium]MBT7483339.1 lamin tail domain-containing protein [Candidatus Peregrinibacteria bacterium]MBT7703228.1 lamin tail domain-containing protein [Candidatus Peregrinibacteria bacterium]
MKKSHPLIALFFSVFLGSHVLAANWAWSSEPTPGALNLFPAGEEEEIEGDLANGDLSENIILSEIMPNPEGTDTDTEWIEIYNTSTTDINLGNWSLDDAEGGSAPFVFPANTVVEAQDFLVIYRNESGLALNNDTDSVRLFDFEENLQDSATYEGSAPEGQSYARILVEEQASASFFSYIIPVAQAKSFDNSPTNWETVPWEWTKEITSGYLNPIYYLIHGVVEEIIPFENKITLSNQDQTMEVSLDELNINENLKTSLLKPGNEISGYASKTANQTYKLQRFTDNSTETSTTNQINWTKNLALLGIIACVGFYFIVHKKKAKQ